MGQLYTSLPLTDASTIKQKKDIEEPKGWLKKLQGLFTVDRDNFLKTCQGPFKSVYAAGSGELLVAKEGIRYFLHSVVVTHIKSAAVNGQGCRVYYTHDGALQYVTSSAIASVASADTTTAILDCLTDEKKAVGLGSINAAPDIVLECTILYCEVPC